MIINFPSSCKTEASRWSYATKLADILRLDHNASCEGMTGDESESWRKSHFYPKSGICQKAINDNIEIARQGAVWNPRIPDHVSGGVISYPPGLNQSNEGSRASFLFGLEDKLRLDNRAEGDADYQVVSLAINQAIIDAAVGTFWNPKLGDIS